MDLYLFLIIPLFLTTFVAPAPTPDEEVSPFQAVFLTEAKSNLLLKAEDTKTTTIKSIIKSINDAIKLEKEKKKEIELALNTPDSEVSQLLPEKIETNKVKIEDNKKDKDNSKQKTHKFLHFEIPLENIKTTTTFNTSLFGKEHLQNLNESTIESNVQEIQLNKNLSKMIEKNKKNIMPIKIVTTKATELKLTDVLQTPINQTTLLDDKLKDSNEIKQQKIPTKIEKNFNEKSNTNLTFNATNLITSIDKQPEKNITNFESIDIEKFYLNFINNKTSENIKDITQITTEKILQQKTSNDENETLNAFTDLFQSENITTEFEMSN